MNKAERLRIPAEIAIAVLAAGLWPSSNHLAGEKS